MRRNVTMAAREYVQEVELNLRTISDLQGA